MSIEDDFPTLAQGGYQVTSPAADNYNCIAWAAGDEQNWWEPSVDDYWPKSAVKDYSVDALVQVFESLGYSSCVDATLENGKEKIAIFGDGRGYTHAARQLSSGAWTSKLGRGEDIEHAALHDLEGPTYGVVVCLMWRDVVVEG